MSFIITPVTAAQINALKVQMNLSGVQVEAITPSTTPGKYQISDGLVHVTAQYSAANNSLDVTIVKKPFWLFESAIHDGLVAELKVLAPPVPAAAGLKPPPPAAPLPANLSATLTPPATVPGNTGSGPTLLGDHPPLTAPVDVKTSSLGGQLSTGAPAPSHHVKYADGTTETTFTQGQQPPLVSINGSPAVEVDGVPVVPAPAPAAKVPA